MKSRKKPVGVYGRKAAEIIREEMQARTLTYRPLAERAGLSLNRLGIILRNEGPAMDLDELSAICEALEIPATAVFIEIKKRADLEKVPLTPGSIIAFPSRTSTGPQALPEMA